MPIVYVRAFVRAFVRVRARSSKECNNEGCADGRRLTTRGVNTTICSAFRFMDLLYTRDRQLAAVFYPASSQPPDKGDDT